MHPNTYRVTLFLGISLESLKNSLLTTWKTHYHSLKTHYNPGKFHYYYVKTHYNSWKLTTIIENLTTMFDNLTVILEKLTNILILTLIWVLGGYVVDGLRSGTELIDCARTRRLAGDRLRGTGWRGVRWGTVSPNTPNPDPSNDSCVCGVPADGGRGRGR